jgi:hypothetical protein
MTEKIRVLMPIEIPNLDEDVDMTSIWRELNDYVKILTSQINIQDLGEWYLLILVNSRSTNGIGVFKRSRRYPSDKEFEISISISIPDEEQAHYGLAKVKEELSTPLNDKNFYILNPDFENYHNLYQYILESSKRAIDLAFTQGFTCNGKKIKFQK